jgi:hypothetical protein
MNSTVKPSGTDVNTASHSWQLATGLVFMAAAPALDNSILTGPHMLVNSFSSQFGIMARKPSYTAKVLG